VIEQRQPNPENFQEKHERQAVQPMNLVDKPFHSAVKRLEVRKHVLDQKKSERNDAEQRMQLTGKIGIRFHNACGPLSIRTDSVIKPFTIVLFKGWSVNKLSKLQHFFDLYVTAFTLIMEVQIYYNNICKIRISKI